MVIFVGKDLKEEFNLMCGWYLWDSNLANILSGKIKLIIENDKRFILEGVLLNHPDLVPNLVVRFV